MNNLGTFTKSGGAALSTIGTTFNNSNIVNVQSGTLNLSGGGTDVGASYTGAGTIQFSSEAHTPELPSHSAAACAPLRESTTTLNGTYNWAGTTTTHLGTAALRGNRVH